MQTYPTIASTRTLKLSRQDLLDRDDSLKSSFSGTAFPTTDVLVGMLCRRTDLGALYQLVSTGPDTWSEIPVGLPLPVTKGGTGATDAATARSNLAVLGLAGGTMTGQIIGRAHGASNTNTDSTLVGFTRNVAMATTAIYAGGIEVRDTSLGAAMISFLRSGSYAAYFGLDTDNQFKVGGWSMGANAYKLWHEGNDGAASGLDADLLDGQQGAYYLPAGSYTQADVYAKFKAQVAPGTSGNVLQSNGTDWVSGAVPAPPSPRVYTDVFTSSGTWTRPAGVDYVEAIVTGGGAGGNGSAAGGNGGFAGGTAIKICNVTGNVTVTIGSGGTAGSSTGGAGGTSSFGSFCSATGGDQASGAGVGSSGDINIRGGEPAFGTNPGLGGASFWQPGRGGNNGSNSGPGNYGSGGAGSSTTNGSTGGGGIVVVRYVK